MSDYSIEAVVSAPFEQVAYVIWRKGRTDAVVGDPGFDVAGIESVLSRHGLSIAAIVNTHGHADHIAGNARLKAAHPEAPLLIGRNDAGMLSSSEANLSAAFGMPLTSPPADRLLDDGERVDLAGFSVEIREIPGHSPGSIVLVFDEFDPPFVLAGDVLFAGSVGRVDFPGGSGPALLRGIKSRLFDLPDGTLILPGHGSPTTIGQEKATNPYVGESAGIHRLD
jgi:glyoxylase-like metal-dependent hydrolase (beta-lactamase superfamily II)